MKFNPHSVALGLAILYILFISIFASDVFAEGLSVPELLLGLFMHLIPSFILIGFTLVAWKHELYGGILFVLGAIFFTLFFHTYGHWLTFMLISIPPLVIGGLFLVSAFKVQQKAESDFSNF